MTINAMISAVNITIAFGLLALGIGLIWRARTRWRSWPVSAGIALGGAFLLTGIVYGQLALFRHVVLPDDVQPNGWGTLVIRGACAVAVIALVRRVFAADLLTPSDRREIGG